MNPLIGELPNVFTGGAVVGKNIPYRQYAMQVAQRGAADYTMSNGELMEFNRCPHRWLVGYESEETRQTEWGNLIDCLALTPDQFKERFSVAPETYPDTKTGEAKPWNWNANFCKNWRAEQGDADIVKLDTYQQAQNAVKILYGKQSTREFLECSVRQMMVTSEYRDAETGISVPVRCLIDLVPGREVPMWGSCLGDLKTGTTAGTGWRRKVYEMNYHVQAAIYLDIFNAATGEKREEFVHIVQESFPPWEPARKPLSAEFIELGRWKYREALARYCQCLKVGQWPGYDEDVVNPEPWMIQ